MQLQTDQYTHHLDGFDLTAAQKAEIVQAVGLMMESFVDIAFGLDATQLCLGINRDDGVGGKVAALNLRSAAAMPFNDAAHEMSAGKTTP